MAVTVTGSDSSDVNGLGLSTTLKEVCEIKVFKKLID